MRTVEANIHQGVLQDIATRKIQRLKRFYLHLIIYAIAVLVFILGRSFAQHIFPLKINVFALSIWTLIIAVQAIRLFVVDIIIGRKWEERQIKKSMNKETTKQLWK